MHWWLLRGVRPMATQGYDRNNQLMAWADDIGNEELIDYKGREQLTGTGYWFGRLGKGYG